MTVQLTPNTLTKFKAYTLESRTDPYSGGMLMKLHECYKADEVDTVITTLREEFTNKRQEAESAEIALNAIVSEYHRLQALLKAQENVLEWMAKAFVKAQGTS